MRYQYNDIISKLLNTKLFFARYHTSRTRGYSRKLCRNRVKEARKTAPYIEGNELLGLAATGDCGCQ